jgi:hypothetical protein
VNVGLPGTGLAGLFYLLAALFMPLWQLLRALRGRSRPGEWRIVWQQAGIALGILLALSATGWLLGLLLVGTVGPASSGGTGDQALRQRVANMLGAAPPLLALITLITVLLAVEILGAIMRVAGTVKGSARH